MEYGAWPPIGTCYNIGNRLVYTFPLRINKLHCMCLVEVHRRLNLPAGIAIVFQSPCQPHGQATWLQLVLCKETVKKSSSLGSAICHWALSSIICLIGSRILFDMACTVFLMKYTNGSVMLYFVAVILFVSGGFMRFINSYNTGLLPWHFLHLPRR